MLIYCWENISISFFVVILSLTAIGIISKVIQKIASTKPFHYVSLFSPAIILLIAFLLRLQGHIYVYEVNASLPGELTIRWNYAITELIKVGLSPGTKFKVECKNNCLTYENTPWPFQAFLWKTNTENQVALMIGGSTEYSSGKINGHLKYSCFYSPDNKVQIPEQKAVSFCEFLQERTYQMLNSIVSSLNKQVFIYKTNETKTQFCPCAEAVESHLGYYENPSEIELYDDAWKKYAKCLHNFPDLHIYRYDLGLLYLHRYETKKDEEFLVDAQDEMKKILNGDKDKNIRPRSGYFPATMQLGNIYWYMARHMVRDNKEDNSVQYYKKALEQFKESIALMEKYREHPEYGEPSLEKRTYFSYANALSAILQETRGEKQLATAEQMCIEAYNRGLAEDKLVKAIERHPIFVGDLLYLLGYLKLIGFIFDGNVDNLNNSKMILEKALEKAKQGNAKDITETNCFKSLEDLLSKIHYGLACVYNYCISNCVDLSKEEYFFTGLQNMKASLNTSPDPIRMFNYMKIDPDLQNLISQLASVEGFDSDSLDLDLFHKLLREIESSPKRPAKE